MDSWTDRDTFDFQQRVIIRLRAALRALGKTSVEVDDIASDGGDNIGWRVPYDPSLRPERDEL